MGRNLVNPVFHPLINMVTAVAPCCPALKCHSVNHNSEALSGLKLMTNMHPCLGISITSTALTPDSIVQMSER